MYRDKRQVVRLSKECWDYLDVIKDVGYANAYTLFWSDHIKLIQQAIRKNAPSIKDDWLRRRYEGKTVTFSLSDNAIKAYKPKIQEFSSFGSAVKILGAYEDYVKKVVEISDQVIPQPMMAFRNKNKKYIHNENSFISYEVGRGIDFFSEVFSYNPHPSYKPALKFFFQLRNIAVHKSGIADKRLIDAANSSHINIMGQLNIGDKISWNPSLLLQLYHLMIDMLTGVDPLICSDLKLTQIEKRAFWYLEAEDAQG